MAAPADERRQAVRLLQEYGIADIIVPTELIAMSKELGKPLREALDQVMRAMAESEGVDSAKIAG